jgi:hypothetical protein
MTILSNDKKELTMKNTNMIMGLLLAAGFSTVASAHNYAGTLKAPAINADKWYFVCQNPNTATVEFQVKKTKGTPCVKATYDATGANATACTTALKPAAPIVITTGPGPKFFTISKNPAIAGTDSYSVSAHCIDNTGVHNPDDQTTPQTYTQNQ